MPWIDDPETGTSHYERPKKKKLRAKTMAEIFNEQQAAKDWQDDVKHAQVEDTTFDGTPLVSTEDPGAYLAALTAELDSIKADMREAVDAEVLGPRVRVAGDGLGRLLKGERYTKAES